MPRETRGAESLPVVLLLGAMLGAGALAIGMACLDQARRMSEQQRAVDSFDLMVERAMIISGGGEGNKQYLELELGSYSIKVDGNLVRLMDGKTAIRADALPLRLVVDGGEIKSGGYLMELELVTGGWYILKMRRA
jgi:hypothetical protein